MRAFVCMAHMHGANPMADSGMSLRDPHGTPVFKVMRDLANETLFRTFVPVIAERPCSIAELATRTNRCTGTTSRHVRTLELYGFVHVHRSPGRTTVQMAASGRQADAAPRMIRIRMQDQRGYAFEFIAPIESPGP